MTLFVILDTTCLEAEVSPQSAESSVHLAVVS